MTNYLGGARVAGGKMKSLNDWNNPNEEATNESGFNALALGYRSGEDGKGYNFGSYAFFWSSVDFASSHAWSRELHNIAGECYRKNYHKRFGLSVRCVKD